VGTIVIEHRFEHASFEPERHDEAQRRNAMCLALHGVRHLVSYVTPDGRRMICVFEAPDAEAVRRAARQLGLALDNVWPATVVRDARSAEPAATR
jgi:hypothetical protein